MKREKKSLAAVVLLLWRPPLPVCSGLRAVACRSSLFCREWALGARLSVCCLPAELHYAAGPAAVMKPSNESYSSLFLVFVPAEDGGWRLVPTSDTVGYFFLGEAHWNPKVSVRQGKYMHAVTCSAPQVGRQAAAGASVEKPATACRGIHAGRKAAGYMRLL